MSGRVRWVEGSLDYTGGQYNWDPLVDIAQSPLQKYIGNNFNGRPVYTTREPIPPHVLIEE